MEAANDQQTSLRVARRMAEYHLSQNASWIAIACRAGPIEAASAVAWKGSLMRVPFSALRPISSAAILFPFLFIVGCTGPVEQQVPTRGIPAVRTSGQQKIPARSEYSGSYALVIGESNYKKGWSSLAKVSSETKDVSNVLRQHRFEVTTVNDATGEQIKRSLDALMIDHGLKYDTRILIYFSGRWLLYKG